MTGVEQLVEAQSVQGIGGDSSTDSNVGDEAAISLDSEVLVNVFGNDGVAVVSLAGESEGFPGAGLLGGGKDGSRVSVLLVSGEESHVLNLYAISKLILVNIFEISVGHTLRRWGRTRT